jgi:hypothetical protein
MKKLIFPLLLLCASTVVAQNYQNVCTPGITFYKNNNNTFLSFRRDSVIPVGSNDTIFISYRAIRGIQNTSCLDTTGGSVLGRKIFKAQSGWFYLFNKSNDTLKINSQATLNQSWRFCPLPGNGYIEAKVTSIITDSVLGTTDAVKVIAFQAKDAGNNNLAHILNQKFIKLSQHYGLSRMLDVFSIPYDTTFYILAGKSFPAMGIQNLTSQEIYNYNIGDEFHFSGWASSAGWSKIIKVLARTDYGNDSVKYTMERCQKTSSANYPYYSTIHDTITATYNFLENSGNTWLSKLPGEFLRISGSWADNYWLSTNSFPNRRLKGVTWGGFLYTWEFYGGDTCWNNVNGYNGPISTENFTEGLGKTRSYWYQTEPPATWQMDENMVYYKKGSETWGTPLATDCFVLVSNEDKATSMEPFAEVSPNPVETDARIFLNSFNPDDNFLYSLYNYSGMKVSEGTISLNPFIFNRKGLSSGLYILSISDRDGNIKGRTKIIFK